MKQIYIYCDGGFGNRFNSLMNGLFIAKYGNYEPKIIWPINNWCGATFTEIFNSTLEEFREFDQQTFFNQHDTNNFMHWNPFQPDLSVINPMGIYVSITDFMQSQPDKDLFFYSSTMCPWIDKQLLKPILDQLPFQPHILTIADIIIEHNCKDQKFFGVHLRCTDHTKSINLDDYIAHVANTPNSKFFICSDDFEIESKFMQYPNAFKYDKTSYVEKLVEGEWNTTITDSTGANFPYNVNRNSESVVQAMIDLVILSRSTLIATDFTSTFLQSAKLIQELTEEI
jgi:hypothetical protein